MRGEQGGRWNSALEMDPLRKSVCSEGSVPQAACRQGVQEGGTHMASGISGSGQGFFSVEAELSHSSLWKATALSSPSADLGDLQDLFPAHIHQAPSL